MYTERRHIHTGDMYRDGYTCMYRDMVCTQMVYTNMTYTGDGGLPPASWFIPVLCSEVINNVAVRLISTLPISSITS